MQSSLRCVDVTKSFGGLVALDGVNIEVGREIVGLIGPNGAGKTTLFNVITGLLTLDSGGIYIDDQEITGWPMYRVARNGIARTFQTPKPIENLTVEENLRISQHFGDTRSETATTSVSNVLELFDLSEDATADPSSLTLIDKKFLEVGKGVLTNPRFLLLDEVMAGLNPSEKEQMVEKLRRINAAYDISLLVIEHDLHAIRSISDRIVVLNDGKVLAEGEPDDVIENQAVREAYVGTHA